MIAKLKAALAIAATYIAFAALVVFWFFSRRRPPKPIHVETKKVPESEDEMLKAARKEGIIK